MEDTIFWESVVLRLKQQNVHNDEKIIRIANYISDERKKVGQNNFFDSMVLHSLCIHDDEKLIVKEAINIINERNKYFNK